MSDSGELQASARRGAQAASVSNRWWENEGAGHPGARTGPAPASPLWQQQPPPPPPPLGEAPSIAPLAQELALPSGREARHLQLELEAARSEIAALHEMLEDLPEIFERKFRQRVHGLMEEQARLLADNQILRDRLYALTPATPTAALALPSVSSFPAQRPRPRLRRGLGSALQRLLGRSSKRPTAPTELRSPGGGRTTAA